MRSSIEYNRPCLQFKRTVSSLHGSAGLKFILENLFPRLNDLYVQARKARKYACERMNVARIF